MFGTVTGTRTVGSVAGKVAGGADVVGVVTVVIAPGPDTEPGEVVVVVGDSVVDVVVVGGGTVTLGGKSFGCFDSKPVVGGCVVGGAVVGGWVVGGDVVGGEVVGGCVVVVDGGGGGIIHHKL